MNDKILITIFITKLLFVINPAYADKPLSGYVPSDVKKVCQISQEDFNNKWVNISLPIGKSGVPIGPFFDKESGIVYVFPANGPNFSTSGQTDTDCAFFEWSSQMFLWMTSTVQDGTQPAPTHPLKHTSVNTPYVFSSEFFYRLDDGVLVPQAHSGPLGFKQLRQAKDDEILDSIGQAGGEGVLFTQPNTKVSTSSSLVYYEVLTNRSYGYVADAVIKKAPQPNNYSEFVDSSSTSCSAIKYGLNNGFVDDSGQTAALLYNIFCPNDPVSINGTPTFPTSIPQLETAIDFLSMNMEIKTAWVEASSLKNPKRFITQKGSIPVFTQVEGKNKMIHSWNKNADLALVGMHIVGSVKGHPELVWATFEHTDNAPNAKYFYENKSGKVRPHTDLKKRTKNNWLLSDGTTASTVTEYGVSYTDSSSSVNYIIPASDQQTAVVSTPSNVTRINPWGSIKGKASATSNSAVISTNISALTLLQDFYSNLGLTNVQDPRLNYMLTGASWGQNGQFPTGKKASQIAGTPAMANTTMETFQQTFLQKNGDNTGCFSCHGINAGSSKFGVSHIFSKIDAVEK